MIDSRLALSADYINGYGMMMMMMMVVYTNFTGVVGSRVLFVGSKYPGRMITVRPEDAPAFSLVCIVLCCIDDLH